MMHVLSVTHEHPSSPQADPARHDPSEARPATCTCSGGTREPDPTDENLRLLRRAANLSMEMMEIAAERARRALAADAAPDADAAADRSDLAFQRSGRSLRFCITLSDKLHADRLERDKKLASDAAFEVGLRKTRLKRKVERLVGEAIRHQVEKETERLTESEGESESYDESEFDEEDESDREDALLAALAERLADEDIEQDLGRCPTSEILGRLCGNLKIQPLWQLWGGEHWALEEARRKVPGSPYGEPPATEPEAAEMPEAKPPPAEAGPEQAAARP